LKRAALVLFGLLLGLVAVEIGLRATAWVFLRMREAPGPLPAKQANHYRILCLGESTTADLLFMGKDSYPAQLEHILNERSKGMSFTVINGGVPATTTDGILEDLPRNLEQQRPDIVVTMMGINDGEPVDPLFRISRELRVWKFAKMLYYKYKWGDRRAALVAKYGPLPPDVMMLTGNVAAHRILAGRYAEAEPLLKSILDQDTWAGAKSRANGLMAVLNWQRGDDVAAERYHRRFVELERQLPRTRTIANYRDVRRILSDRHIPLVAVQYPGLPVDILRNVVERDPRLTIVDNEQTFLQLTKERPARELYRDLFGGIFGHLTPYANGLLAQNVARGILGMMADRSLGHGNANPAGAAHPVGSTSPTAPGGTP
jgi:lysophospholipase L1-like esterase